MIERPQCYRHPPGQTVGHRVWGHVPTGRVDQRGIVLRPVVIAPTEREGRRPTASRRRHPEQTPPRDREHVRFERPVVVGAQPQIGHAVRDDLPVMAGVEDLKGPLCRASTPLARRNGSRLWLHLASFHRFGMHAALGAVRTPRGPLAVGSVGSFPVYLLSGGDGGKRLCTCTQRWRDRSTREPRSLAAGRGRHRSLGSARPLATAFPHAGGSLGAGCSATVECSQCASAHWSPPVGSGVKRSSPVERSGKGPRFQGQPVGLGNGVGSHAAWA